MEFIREERLEKQTKIQDITFYISLALKQLGIYLVKIQLKQQLKKILLLSSKVSLPYTRHILDLLWEVLVTPKAIRIRLKMDSTVSLVCQAVCLAFKNNSQELTQFICQINNLRLKDKEGLFYYQPHTGQVGLQTKINGIHFLSSTAKTVALVKSRLCSYIKIFTQEIESIVFYFKLPIFHVYTQETQVQKQNYISIKNLMRTITLLRTFFAKKRLERQQAQMQQCRMNDERAILNALTYLYGYNFNKAVLVHSNVSGEDLKWVQSEYLRQRNLLNKDMVDYQNQGFDPILTTIEIKTKTHEKMIDSGGYSQIIYGIYNFIPQLSIHKEVSENIKSSAYLKKGYHLVKKKALQGSLEPSLKNQFNFLIYVRNKVCPYFAKYYCNNGPMPFSDGEVYIQYYPSSLADCHLKEQQKLKVIEDVCMGLYFLAGEGIIHRDLKECNIMVDRNKRGRIIDFGSVASITGSPRYKAFDDKIRTTEGYYLPYAEAVRMVPCLSTLISRQDYYSHKAFDLYGLGKILHNEFYLDYIIGQSHFFRYNLKYLNQKCLQPNPDDRPTLQQITVFLRQLMIYNACRTEFWKFKFNEKCKVHTFGSLRGDRQMSLPSGTQLMK